MPEDIKEKRLALFFTLGVSLKTWHEIGIITREVAIYNRLSRHFRNIYFFTYGCREDLDYKKYLAENITVVPFPFFRKKESTKVSLLLLLYSMLIPLIHFRILRNVDILKTNQMSGSWSAVFSKILFRKKLVVRTGYTWAFVAAKKKASGLKQNLIRMIEKIAYSFSDGVIVSSGENLNYVKEHYKIKSVERVIPNYVDTDLFTPDNGETVKDSICFVGRLSREKNLFSLLEAVVELPLTVTIIGSGILKRELEDYAKARGIKAEFRGNIPNNELPRVLNQHDAFILPSLYEGMPKALLEAMSCGLPCIGTDVEGIRNIITHEENGYLCHTDAPSIRKALSDVMKDETLRKKMGENARKTVLINYGFEKILQQELSLYKSL